MTKQEISKWKCRLRVVNHLNIPSYVPSFIPAFISLFNHSFVSMFRSFIQNISKFPIARIYSLAHFDSIFVQCTCFGKNALNKRSSITQSRYQIMNSKASIKTCTYQFYGIVSVFSLNIIHWKDSRKCRDSISYAGLSQQNPYKTPSSKPG